MGTEDPEVTAAAKRWLPQSPGLLAVPLEEMATTTAIMSPEEELNGCELEVNNKRPAVLPLLERVGEVAKSSGADGSLPSTPLPPEDELYHQSLEIITRYLREQATGSKDSKPLSEAGRLAGGLWRPCGALATAYSATTRRPSRACFGNWTLKKKATLNVFLE